MSSSMEKFLDKTKADNKIVEMYIELRKYLQSADHTSVSIQNISKAPPYIWKLMDDIRNEVSILRDTLNRYGILESDETYNSWLENRLKHINKEYPLIDERDD